MCVRVCGCGVSNVCARIYYTLCICARAFSLLGLNIVAEISATEASGGKVLPGVCSHALGYERVCCALHIFIWRRTCFFHYIKTTLSQNQNDLP